MNIDKARELAAQAWCQPATSGIEMDVILAEEFARLLSEHTEEVTVSVAMASLSEAMNDDQPTKRY